MGFGISWVYDHGFQRLVGSMFQVHGADIIYGPTPRL